VHVRLLHMGDERLLIMYEIDESKPLTRTSGTMRIQEERQ